MEYGGEWAHPWAKARARVARVAHAHHVRLHACVNVYRGEIISSMSLPHYACLPPGPGSRRRNSLMSRAATTRARTRARPMILFLPWRHLPSRDRLSCRRNERRVSASSNVEGDPLLHRSFWKIILRREILFCANNLRGVSLKFFRRRIIRGIF